MPDSTGAEQDGATTDWKARFDGLMSSHQRTLAENVTLKGRLGSGNELAEANDPTLAQDQGDDITDDLGDSQPDEDEDEADNEPPTPKRHNQSRTQSARTERTTEDLRGDLDRLVGRPTRSHDWTID